MTREFGLESAPAGEFWNFVLFLDFSFEERDGFFATWLWYNKITDDLKKKTEEEKFGKRGVGNLYECF